MKIAYIKHRFSRKTHAIIERANEIITEYEAEGMSLTLRQIFYKFIARDWFPDTWIDPEYNKRKGLAPTTKNTEKNYERLGSTLSMARLAGLVSWRSMEDRTRHLRDNSHWDSPAAIVEATARDYAIDKWATQKCRVEVWIEKDALTGVIDPVCRELDVPYFSCRGYTSQSEQWRAGMRLREYVKEGKRPVVFHLGDHDPSGLDMTRDNTDRLSMFCGAKVDFRRIGLTKTQIDKYDPPPNPTKATDSRSPKYVAQFGEKCWELDALEPRVLRQLIVAHVGKLRDNKAWKKAVAKEQNERRDLELVSEHFPAVQQFVSEQ